MTLLLLWLLATVDSALIGYRDAAGRSALIKKRKYYRQAMIRGALLGQLAVAIVGLVAVGMLVLSPRPAVLLADFERVGARMVIVYVSYALILILTFMVRAIPSVDIRSITSVLVFGPFTLIRPFVVLAGAIWGLLLARAPGTVVLVLLILSLMLGLEPALGRLRARRIIA